MDPLSITTAVVTLTGVCLTTVKRISDVRDRFKLASATLTAILSETTVVSASLGQVQTALLRNGSQFTTRFESDSALLHTLDTALIGCSVVVSALHEEIDKLEVGLLKAQVNGNDSKTQLNWKLRMKVLWKEGAMKELLTQIRSQQTSLGFLLQALALDSMSDLNNLIANNSSLLERLAKGTSTLRETYPSIQTPRSLFDTDRDDGVSVFSHTASSAGVTEFDFDNFLIDSPIYRRAFMGGYLRPRRIADDDSDHTAGETETIRESHSDASPRTVPLSADTVYVVETTDGAVELDAKSITEMLTTRRDLAEKHEELNSKYAKVKRYYFDKHTQVEQLEREKEGLDTAIKAKDEEITKLKESEKYRTYRHSQTDSMVMGFKQEKEYWQKMAGSRFDEILELTNKQENLLRERDTKIQAQINTIRDLQMELLARNYAIEQLKSGQDLYQGKDWDAHIIEQLALIDADTKEQDDSVYNNDDSSGLGKSSNYKNLNGGFGAETCVLRGRPEFRYSQEIVL